MKITFYKNCILTNKYGDVFDVFKKDENQNTALDRYLNSLENTTVEFDDIYYTNSGKLNFDIQYIYNIYDYNYLKIEEQGVTSENVPYFIRRFCFIDNITIYNGEVVLSYSEDVWHSYANGLHTRHSLLTRKRLLSYTEKGVETKIQNYKTPIDFISNSSPSIGRFDYTNTDSCVLIIEYQTYEEKEQGKVTRRDLGLSAIIYNETSTGIGYQYDIKTPLKQISSIINNLLLSSSTPNTFNASPTIKLNFDITNIYVLPVSLSKLNKQSFQESIVNRTINMVNKEGKFKLIPIEYVFIGRGEPVYEGEIVEIVNYPLPEKIGHFGRNVTVGTFSSQFDVSLTADSFNTIDVSFTINASHLSILLGVGSNYQDITKDFIVNYPISIDTANVTHLKDITREYSSLNNTMQIVSSTINGTVGLLTGGAMFGMGMPEMGIAKASGGIASSAIGIGNAVINDKKINEQVYTSSKSKVAVNNVAMTNASYGICYFDIGFYINEIEVEKAIENEGYICCIYVDDILQENNPRNRESDVIKFDDVNLYGNFPQDIANKLSSILINGIKIWYVVNV